MNSLFGISGIGFTLTILIISIFANILITSVYTLVVRSLWAKKGDAGSIGPDGELGDLGDDGDRGIQGKKGTIKGVSGLRGFREEKAEFQMQRYVSPFQSLEHQMVVNTHVKILF